MKIEVENKISDTEKLTNAITNVTIHKDLAIQKINSLMNNYINDVDTIDKADKLSYWLEDYCRFLNFEKEFKPNFLKTYSRGDVIKVNLGYNIGNEEGGLHYCIVLDKHNSKNSGIITVIPLTSDKGKPIHFSEVHLGNEIFVNFNKKFETLQLQLTNKMNELTSMDKNEILVENLDKITENLRILIKIREELSKMKKGSIAMVSQITTISKQRIYDPQKTGDILSGLRISDASLDLINEKMKQLFIK